MTALCPSCPHPVREHSREPGVGCLHVYGTANRTLMGEPVSITCPCTEPGDSAADQ